MATARLRLMAAAAAAALAAPLWAGEAQDRIFRVGLFAEVEAGQTLVFGRERGGRLAAGAAPPIEGGAVAVTVTGSAEAGARRARIELSDGSRTTGRTVLPADGGHPVMLVFLETTAQAMAELTGGSPFYIKNRMREALGADVPVARGETEVAGRTQPSETLAFQPFAHDPNRGAMGPFADLVLTMVLSEAAPGGFARFQATAGEDAAGAPAFVDTIEFERIEEAADAPD